MRKSQPRSKAGNVGIFDATASICLSRSAFLSALRCSATLSKLLKAVLKSTILASTSDFEAFWEIDFRKSSKWPSISLFLCTSRKTSICVRLGLHVLQLGIYFLFAVGGWLILCQYRGWNGQKKKTKQLEKTNASKFPPQNEGMRTKFFKSEANGAINERCYSV